MIKKLEHTYEQGPTTCAPTPEVLKSVKQEIKASRALSRADIRLAAAMGLVSADVSQPLGYNDGVFYPLEESVARSAPGVVKPMEMVSLAPQPQQRTMHALVLLVDFSDNPGTRPKSDFESLLFDANDPNSLTSYYRELSDGVLNVTGEAIGYIRAPQPYSFYTAGQSGTGFNYPQNTPGLLFDVLTSFCQTDSLQRFDVDGDGYVDGIFLIHAGGGAEAEPDPTKRPHMIWSHKWVLPTPFVNNGVKVYAYSTEPEDGRVGVFAHEFGHVLGLPDLYDTTYRSRGIGNWCLMAGGSWGGGGNRPVRMSCWCLSQLGWIVPNVVKKASVITMQPLEADKNACYRLWTRGKSGPEYFLIENRQKTGYDVALPGSGLAVWHIDETQSNNTNPLSYLVALVQADGKRDLEFNRNSGDSGDLFPGSNGITRLSNTTMPSTHSNIGKPTNVTLSQISEKGGLVKVRIRV
jgi:immune inhibitor A